LEKEITLTREELYAKVWAVPMRTLAAELELSDVALAKRCRKMDIPLPGLGYWAKAAAGKKPRTRALPQPGAAIPASTVFAPKKRDNDERKVPIAVAESEAREEMEENKVVVPDVLSRPHALVQQTMLDFKQQKQRATNWSWQTSRRLDIDVSDGQFDRALRTMDTLLKALDQRGWSAVIEKEDYRSRLCAVIHGQKVPFGIRERIKKVKNDPATPVRGYDGRMYTPYQQKFRDEHTGRLSLVIRSRWNGMRSIEKSWDDTATGHVEDQLNEFITGLVSYAEEWNEWDCQRAEGERLATEAARARAEAAQRHEAEEKRRRELELEAQHWLLSNNIRAYLAAVQLELQNQSIAPEPELLSWQQWATAHADRLDPLPIRIALRS
jgi:hypothetical protein